MAIGASSKPGVSFFLPFQPNEHLNVVLNFVPKKNANYPKHQYKRSTIVHASLQIRLTEPNQSEQRLALSNLSLNPLFKCRKRL
jgi:predicted metalloenzyme YecM